MAQIRAKDLDISYGSTKIVADLNLEIPEGKITAVIGPNGCGKSTILKSLARILPIQSGSILLDGKDIHRLPSVEVAQKLALLPQSPTAPEGLLVEELVAYGRYPHQKGFGRLTGADREKIDWALELTGLTAFKQRAAETLSGGQRQRVWIAMALAQDTELILLDEPTTYLDLVHQLEVLKLLKRLNLQQGKTIALVIHELNMAARFADHMVAVREGAIVAQGSPDVIMTPEVLQRVFDIDAVIGKDPRTGRNVCVTYDIAGDAGTL